MTPRAGTPPAAGGGTPRRGRLSRPQFASLMLVSVFPTVVLLLPGDLLRLGGRDGWWTPLLLAPPPVVVAWGVGRLGAGRGESVRAAIRSLGPVAGRGLLVAMWFAVGEYVATIIPEATQLAGTTFVSGVVPLLVLAALIVPVCVLLAWWGPIVLGRTAMVIVPVLAAVFLGVLGAAVPSMHVLWGLPLRPHNARFAALAPLARTGAFVVEPIFLAPIVLGRADARTRRTAGALLALLVSAVTLLIAVVTWFLIADGGVPGAAASTIPFFGLVDVIGFGPTVQDLETIVLPVLTMGTILKLAVFLWAWARLGSGWSGLRLNVVLPLQAALATWLGLALFLTLLVLDHWLYLEGCIVVPVLVAGSFLPYARRGFNRRDQRA